MSLLSTFLRVVQAAIREAARSTPAAVNRFAARPEPVLFVSVDFVGEGESERSCAVALTFSFADGATRRCLRGLSKAVFETFLSALEDHLKARAQPGLWGDSMRLLRGASEPAEEGTLEWRVAQVWEELSRFRDLSLTLGGSGIDVVGGSVEIRSSS